MADYDLLYVEARRVLLDALEALRPHRAGVIVVGAQAVYLRTGAADLAVAPYTTDGDLALDPQLLLDVPELENAMRQAGFALQPSGNGAVEPGIWSIDAIVAGRSTPIPIDLIVPEDVVSPGGRRGARLGVHGNRAARRAKGLEAALIDHEEMPIVALDPRDDRAVATKVAGPVALLIAKAYKIHDRLESRPDRSRDKDGADIYRLMRTHSTEELRPTAQRLLGDERTSSSTEQGLEYLRQLFGARRAPGVDSTVRALVLAEPEARIRDLCTRFVQDLLHVT